MFLNYFAGGELFTAQEVFMFCAVAFLVLGMTAGLVIFAITKLLHKNREQAHKHPLIKSILIGFALIAFIIIALFVVPTHIKDSNWERKQQECAEKVGYSGPADDSSNLATAESQAAYNKCLGD